MRHTRYALALGALMLTGTAFGQVIPPATGTSAPPAAPAAPPTPVAPAKSAPYGGGMKINISPDGSKYLRFLLWTQVYARYTENNTGTLRAPSQPKESQVDFGIRRSRMVLIAQLNPRFLIYTHLGINNQNSVSGGVAPTVDGKKPQFFIHEAVTEYKVNKYLSLGGGLHYYNGISRLTNASTTSILPMDLPLTNFPTIETTDQFARWLGIYAKGRVGKFDYRVAMDDAFLTNLASTPLSLGVTTPATTTTPAVSTGTGVANFNPQNTSHVYQGYFSYNFLEPEANLLPYTQGTYLGTKRVFSIGSGFLYSKDAMYSRAAGSAVNITSAVTADPFANVGTNKHDMVMLGFDAFYDAPIDTASSTALTLYGVYYNFNMGPNFVRFVGAENPGYGTAPLRGNAVPLSGTGGVFYGQVGLLLPKKLLGPKARLQPYVAYQHANYEGLKTTSGDTRGVNIMDAGVNLLLDGHNAKVTLNYRPRPDFTNVNDIQYRTELTLQTQIFL
ncbi:hypothetical protein [Hymenobacter sp. UYCo722]|uniref:hypothetical protein n=1 Tax=Hymenobacter sp. UYCo722 TaxID=3156335 RepID=UPI003398C015